MKKLLLLLFIPCLLFSQDYPFRGNIVPDTTNDRTIGKEFMIWKQAWIGEINATVFSKQSLNLVGGALRMGKNCGTLKYSIDENGAVADFGQSMTVYDLIEFRGVNSAGNQKLEYMRVGALVRGTAYLVTRNLDGTGANSWAKGTPYSVVGKWGNGWLDLASYTLPRISLNVQHDSTWNHFTEIQRIGNLDGNWGYTATAWGMAVGSYSNNSSFITIDTVNGIRMRHKDGSGNVTDKVRIEPDGDSYFTGNMTISNQGSITISGFNNDSEFNHVYYGASTPSSPIEGDTWFKQAAGDTALYRYDGASWDKISVRMDANGLYADNIYANQITSGTFSGKTFTGGSFVGTSFSTGASGSSRLTMGAGANQVDLYVGSDALPSGTIRSESSGVLNVEGDDALYLSSDEDTYLEGVTLHFTGAIDGISASDVGAIASGGAYTDLSNNSKIGTGSAQVAAGNHNHSGVYAPASEGAVFSSHSATSGRYVATSPGGSPTTQMGWVVLTINGVAYTVFTSD